MSVVARTPLTELITPRGPAQLLKEIDADFILELLKQEVPHFVVAEVGLPLQWISEADRFGFWKEELQPHLIRDSSRIRLEELPGEYGYLATLWRTEKAHVFIVLQKFH